MVRVRQQLFSWNQGFDSLVSCSLISTARVCVCELAPHAYHILSHLWGVEKVCTCGIYLKPCSFCSYNNGNTLVQLPKAHIGMRACVRIKGFTEHVQIKLQSSLPCMACYLHSRHVFEQIWGCVGLLNFKTVLCRAGLVVVLLGVGLTLILTTSQV